MAAGRGRNPLDALATVMLTLLTVVTAVGFCRLFPDWSFLGPMVLVAIAVHLVSAVLRAGRVNVVLSVVVSFAVIAVTVGMVFYRDTLFGFLPTRATWDAAWQELADAFSLFPTTVAPVPADGGFAVALTGAIGLAATLSDAFAFRAYGRLEALVPNALLFVTAAALGTDRNRLTVTALWIGVAIVTLAVLRAAHGEPGAAWLGGPARARTIAIVGGGASLALVAVIAGAALGPRLPGAQAEALIDTRNRAADGTQVISPLVDVQARLVNRSNVELFTVRSDVQTYWRLTTMEEFDGRQFRAPDRRYVDAAELDAGEIPAAAISTQAIEIVSLGSIFLPAAADVVDVASTEPLIFDETTRTLARDGNLFPGLAYTVQSVVPSFGVDVLSSATSDAPPDPAYLELPDDFPTTMSDLAGLITTGAPSSYAKALALQQYFRDNFDYDVNVSRGHSVRSIEAFINLRAGYCEQFSVSFAALGRAVGLPTRVAVGFTPGDRDDTGTWHVRGKHAHAWPEVWFDQLGWVPFEPTPGRGIPGAEAYTGVAAEQDGGVLTEPAATPANDPTQATAAPVSTIRPTLPTIPIDPDDLAGLGGSDSGSTAPPAAGAGRSVLPWVWTVLALLVAAGAWLLVMPPVVRARSHRHGHASPAEQTVAGWQRAVGALALIGARRRPNETPVEHARRASRMTGIDAATLDELARAATRATYAADVVDQSAADHAVELAGRIGRLASQRIDWQGRLVARFDPRRATVLG